MKLLKNIIKSSKIYPDDYKNTLERCFVIGKSGEYYTDGKYLYKQYMFLTGKINAFQTAIDDYALKSDEYTFVYVPIMKKTTPKELQEKINNFWKNKDFLRNENMDKKALEELEKMFDEVKEEYLADLDYIKEKFKIVIRNNVKWELYKIGIDMITGKDIYGFRAVLEDRVFDLLLPKKLYAILKSRDLIETFKERSDLLDPMTPIRKGTLYTLQKEEVEKILNDWNKKRV